jgi:RNA 3'-phosphate cyclase
MYFSIALNKAIHVSKIRAGRDVPGLRQQHSAILRILREISNGRLEGGEVGSTDVSFIPGQMEDKSISFDLGTAASITLVLQALVPAVALSGSSLRASFVGGTDVPWSPTSDYLAYVVRPALASLGIDFEYTLGRRGYYPRGGGTVNAVINPCTEVRPIVLPLMKHAQNVSLMSRCGSLPRHVAERQASAASSLLKQKGLEVAGNVISVEESNSPGSSILISLVDGCFIGADALGRKGVKAEQVGEDAAAGFVGEFTSGASVDQNLADTIAPILCMSRSPSTFYVREITGHLKTSLNVARLFTGADFEFLKSETCWMVKIAPQQNS